MMIKIKIIIIQLLFGLICSAQIDSLSKAHRLCFNTGLSLNLNNSLNKKELESNNTLFTNLSFFMDYRVTKRVSLDAGKFYYLRVKPLSDNPFGSIKILSQLGINYNIRKAHSIFSFGVFHSWASFGPDQLYAKSNNGITHYPERGIGIKCGVKIKDRLGIFIQSHYLYDSYNGVKIGPDIENTYLSILYSIFRN